ncbi:Uncharacterised protein [Bordetella pertussis]|nr:Uncharacterised protein [Bordetella pertussis]
MATTTRDRPISDCRHSAGPRRPTMRRPIRAAACCTWRPTGVMR